MSQQWVWLSECLVNIVTTPAHFERMVTKELFCPGPLITESSCHIVIVPFIRPAWHVLQPLPILMWFWPASSLICGNKMPTRYNRGFIADLIACSTCFGHHYAHHQELKSIIQWLLSVVFRAVVFKLLVWCRAEGYVSGLQDAAASCKPETWIQFMHYI